MLGQTKPVILLSSRSSAMARTLKDTILSSDIDATVEVKITSNGHADPLHGVTQKPDVLLLHLSERASDELRSLIELQRERRPELVVVADPRKVGSMRLAMQAGARDYIAEPVNVDELIDALKRVVEEAARVSTPTVKPSSLNVFVNSKGGCGATFLASNVAHIMTAASRLRVALLDLDLQFGSLPLYLDLKLKHGLARALESIEDLDSTALGAYMTVHESGLKVLGNTPEQVLLPREVETESLLQLLNALQSNHEQVIVDLPRRIDHFSATVLERATRIALVVQQNVTSLRDGGRMVNILRNELAINKERLLIVVNRYDKNLDIEIGHIKKSLGDFQMIGIPNRHKEVSESINLGVPIYDFAPNSPVCKALMKLETVLGGTAHADQGNLLTRTWAQLRGS